MGALTRVLQEEFKKSTELTFNILRCVILRFTRLNHTITLLYSFITIIGSCHFLKNVLYEYFLRSKELISGYYDGWNNIRLIRLLFSLSFCWSLFIFLRIFTYNCLFSTVFFFLSFLTSLSFFFIYASLFISLLTSFFLFLFLFLLLRVHSDQCSYPLSFFRIFLAFSNFMEMHGLMAGYRIGLLTMKVWLYVIISIIIFYFFCLQYSFSINFDKRV